MIQQASVDVDRWIPKRWDEVAGNQELVEHYQDILRDFVEEGEGGMNTMVLGKSRTGKTSTTKLFVKCLLCQQLDSDTLNPCGGVCDYCKANPRLWGLSGLEVFSLLGSERPA